MKLAQGGCEKAAEGNDQSHFLLRACEESKEESKQQEWRAPMEGAVGRG